MLILDWTKVPTRPLLQYRRIRRSSPRAQLYGTSDVFPKMRQWYTFDEIREYVRKYEGQTLSEYGPSGKGYMCHTLYVYKFDAAELASDLATMVKAGTVEMKYASN